MTVQLSSFEGVCNSLSNPVPIKNSDDINHNPCIKRVEDFLGKLETKVAVFPKVVEHSRFGDPNFRLWHKYMLGTIPGLFYHVKLYALIIISIDFIRTLKSPIDEVCFERVQFDFYKVQPVTIGCCARHLRLPTK